MRDIGGAVAVAAVSTVLISQAREAGAEAALGAQQSILLDGFHTAFLVIFVLAALGGMLAIAASARDRLTGSRPAGRTGAMLETGLPEVVRPGHTDIKPDRQTGLSNNHHQPTRMYD
jgi:hypothetical protein